MKKEVEYLHKFDLLSSSTGCTLSIHNESSHIRKFNWKKLIANNKHEMKAVFRGAV